MELLELIAQLSDPAAYPHPVDAVEVRQTHISVVFLAGEFAYKIKKPVALGFLDFSTLEKRQHFCQEELRLNRRLAPTVYRAVVPICATAKGVKVGGDGEPLEWAVQMERLPEQASLGSRLQRSELDAKVLQQLARTLAVFHVEAESDARTAAFGSFDVVARNARENFTQAAAQVGRTVSQAVYDRLQALTEATLSQLHPLIEQRCRGGIPRDTHGDLRLDHVYLFPERPAPDDLVVIDCIEFSERFRYADPVADMAFLVMDLKFHGRRDLAQTFAASYFLASTDESGTLLLPFYTAYRAIVRAKVEGIESVEKEIPDKERHKARTRAQGHWLLALGELEEPQRKPCLILVAGLPGAGKSTLARGLAEQANGTLIRSDVVRKELTGSAVGATTQTAFGEGIYAPAWTERTYADCLTRAEQLLFEGKRVIVDASFSKEAHRQTFLDLAARFAVPVLLFHCNAPPDLVRSRLEQRHGDASDADWAIHQLAARQWEEFSPATRAVLHPIETSRTQEEVQHEALTVLRQLSLADR